MNLLTATSAELRKAVTLPAAWAGIAVAILGSLGITLLNAPSASADLASPSPTGGLTSPFDIAFAALPLGTVGAVIIGVVVFSSEYTAHSAEMGGGRQITASLAAVPNRLRLLTAKITTTVLLVSVLAAVTIPMSVIISRLIIGSAAETTPIEEMPWRMLGAGFYWILTGLMALAITVFTRSGVIPLIILIMNNSLVSFSFLLTQVTDLANWLPDMAGRSLFGGEYVIDGAPGPLAGAVTMVIWTAGLLLIAALVFQRRDA